MHRSRLDHSSQLGTGIPTVWIGRFGRHNKTSRLELLFPSIQRRPRDARLATEVGDALVVRWHHFSNDLLFELLVIGRHKNTRSEEHTSELKSLMRISYAVFCLKNKNKTQKYTKITYSN